MYKGRAHQDRDAEVIALIPATPHTSRRVLDTHCVPTARTRQERRYDTERLGTVGIITQDMRKTTDSAKLAFVPTV